MFRNLGGAQKGLELLEAEALTRALDKETLCLGRDAEVASCSRVL